MLVFSNVDLFNVYNGLLQRWHKNDIPPYHYGISDFFATATQPEKAIVFDAELAFADIKPVPTIGSVNGVIDWDAVASYINMPRKRLPVYKRRRSTLVEEKLEKASVDGKDKHSLSAMLSNFTPTARPAVKAAVVAFLTDPKATQFKLPPELQPKRGRAVDYYEAATQADYAALKAEIQTKLPTTYNSRYWLSVINAVAKKAAK